MDKISQRKTAQQLRASLSPRQRQEKSRLVCRKLSELEEVKNADLVFSYMAIKDELSLKELNEKLLNMGKKLCFPVSDKNGIMQAYIPGKWRAGMYGITEPEPESSELVAPEKISLVLAPCLGFDEKGNRLGYGGGYYDRYLPNCVNAEIIACAFEIQKLPVLRTDEFDCKIHIAVTEKNIYRF